MSESDAPRRSTHIEVPATYAAVGASQADDLLRFPPESSTPFYEEVLLGSGENRFVVAAAKLMTWGAHRGAGVKVEPVNESSDSAYQGVDFNDAGVPELSHTDEQRFAPDGTQFLASGNVVRLTWVDRNASREVRVVSVVDETDRVGFVLGTADSIGVTGEVFFCVEHRADGTVWASARGFLVPPKEGFLGLKGKAMLKDAIERAKEQLRALTPVGSAANASTPGAKSSRAE